MTLVFNELSARSMARTTHDARERATNMVEAIAAIAGERAATLVTIDSFDLYGAALADDYTIFHWLNDNAVERDLKTLLRTISTKITFDQDVSETVKDRFLLSDFRLDGRRADGMGLAYLLATTAVSLRSAEWWGHVHIRLRYTWLDVDGVEHSKVVVALNIADRDQVDTVNDELLKRARDKLTRNPTGLADRRQECFPHLRFGSDVDGQLSVLPRDILDQLISKLIVLDGAVRDWRRDGSHSPVLPKVHPESERTMQRYGDRRVFGDVDGIPKEYRPHVMVGDAHRIHFAVDHGNKTLEIGYIGRHLPTALFPH